MGVTVEMPIHLKTILQSTLLLALARPRFLVILLVVFVLNFTGADNIMNNSVLHVWQMIIFIWLKQLWFFSQIYSNMVIFIVTQQTIPALQHCWHFGGSEGINTVSQWCLWMQSGNGTMTSPCNRNACCQVVNVTLKVSRPTRKYFVLGSTLERAQHGVAEWEVMLKGSRNDFIRSWRGCKMLWKH